MTCEDASRINPSKRKIIWFVWTIIDSWEDCRAKNICGLNLLFVENWGAAKFFGKHHEFALVFDSTVPCTRKWPKRTRNLQRSRAITIDHPARASLLTFHVRDDQCASIVTSQKNNAMMSCCAVPSAMYARLCKGILPNQHWGTPCQHCDGVRCLLLN